VDTPLVYFSGGTAYEGAFFKQTPGSTCFTNSGTDFGGIVFAEHRN